MDPGLNKFCCCCTTRTGALFIGTAGWIFTLIQIFAAGDPRYPSIYEQQEYDVGQHNMFLRIGYGLVILLVCILLVVGVYKKDKRYMLPWLVLKGFEASLVVILAIIMFFIACINAQGELFAIFFVVTLVAVLHWYFWVCVWSHYRELKEPVAQTVVYSATCTAPPQYTEKSENMV